MLPVPSPGSPRLLSPRVSPQLCSGAPFTQLLSPPLMSTPHPLPAAVCRVSSDFPVAGRRGFCCRHYRGCWPSEPGVEWAPVPAADAPPPWVACRPTARPLCLALPSQAFYPWLICPWHRRRYSLLTADAKLEYSGSIFKVKV